MLNAGARSALSRLGEIVPDAPRWDGPSVVRAMRQFLGALGLPLPEWVRMAASLKEARGIAVRGRCGIERYVEAVRQRVLSELGAPQSTASARYREVIDEVFGHPVFEALIAVDGGWSRKVLVGPLRLAVQEAIVAIGARAALLSGDLIWTYDRLWAAIESGLGWFTLVDDGLVVVPRPAMAMPRGRLHCVDGPAVRWTDGAAQYFLEGVRFSDDVHRRLVQRTMSAREALSFTFPDQQLLAMAAAPPDEVLTALGAVHLDTGPKGTRLYRIDGFFTRGQADYCIVMTDPSTGRRYLEWVDPDVGGHHNAELCQAHMFGIDLCEWLSLRVEG